MDLDEVVYVVDENLLRLGNGIVAVRRDTARFSRPPVHELLYAGILDSDWVPIVGDRGWVVITSDRCSAGPTIQLSTDRTGWINNL